MAGKRRSGLANDRRAYTCGICYKPPPAPAPIPTPYAPTPDTTIIEYLVDQVVTSFIWSGVTFTRDTNLPGFSYTAITTAIPGSPAPNVSSIGSITIGNIVTSIGTSAFFGGTNSSSLTFTPTSTLTSIGANAFQNCFSDPSISTSITIPNSVTSIGTNAFRNCDSLASVTLPTNPLFISIGTSVFQACDALISVIIPNSVTSIGTSAFFGCIALASVTLSSTLISIGNTAFRLCPLLPTTIPISVTSIGAQAFQLSGLTNVSLSTFPRTISATIFLSPASGVSFFGATVTTSV